MAVQAAGILLYRKSKKLGVEFFLVHSGGPFWAKKDNGVWSIPKGELDPEDENLLAAAHREFEEEIGRPAPQGDGIQLTPVKASGGKVNHIWAIEGDMEAEPIKSNMIEITWPPRSGKKMQIPEVDRAGWFTYAKAKKKLFASQVPFIEELAEKLGVAADSRNAPAKDAPPEQASLF
jgi:predicted NUDIX family NTP pyrophosphohydrolase